MDKSVNFTRMGTDATKDHGFILHSFTRDEWMNEITGHQTVIVTIGLYCRGTDGPLRKDNADLRLARRIKSLEMGKLCDFTIIADDGSTFRVHRILLASLSEVFEAMVSAPGMLEKETGELQLPDTSSDALAVTCSHSVTKMQWS